MHGFEIFTVLAISLIGVPNVMGHGYMRIQFKSYINNDGRCSDGTFCDPIGVLDVRQTPCDPYFNIVADRTLPGGNGLYSYQTGVHWDVDRVDFGSKVGDVDNPVTIDMSYSDNPGSIHFRVTVMDKDPIGADDHMDTFSASLTAHADGVRRDVEMLSPPMMSRLQVQYWYSCHTNYYGLDCNKFCAPHNDDVNGHYTCDSSGNRVCMDGWIGVTCTQRHPCISNPCSNGGTCTNVGGVASCACPHGITGSRCELDVNECAGTSPCVNGGTCVNSFGGFSCSCPTGLTGSRCELDVNECLKPEQCANGGTCVNSFGNFSCLCPSGFTGTRCELDVNECAGTSPCLNGGTCVNSHGGFSCSCPAGLTGSLCELDVNECLKEEQCVNGGTCVNSFGNFTCVCPSGLTGRHCEEDMDECQVTPCLNGGVCMNSFGNFSCNCTDSFTGKLCEEDVNECLEDEQCVNGGTCVNNIGGFDCQCPSGYNGTRCELDVDECVETSPCVNGGTCVNSFGNFSCHCTPGFTGRRCEEDMNECVVTSPCVNGGTCVNSFGNFSCHCTPGFTGRRCDEDVNECVATSPCVNGGTCVNSIGNFSCMCPLQFSGRHCERRPCDDVVCPNNGTCEAAADGAARCRCSAGFGGSTCGQSRVTPSAQAASSKVMEISIGSGVGGFLLVGAIVGIVVGVLVHRGAIESCRSPQFGKQRRASDEVPQFADNAVYTNATEDEYTVAVDDVGGNSGGASNPVYSQDIYSSVQMV